LIDYRYDNGRFLQLPISIIYAVLYAIRLARALRENAMNDHEADRLDALKQLNLLDTPVSESFDRITRMAKQLFGLPIAAISLTDRNRQWFKSRVGLDQEEFPRHQACCAEVTESSRPVIIPDLRASEQYANSNLAKSGIRFYAGAPLTTRDGHTLGAMCVLGKEPRTLTEDELLTLKDLAAMTMAQIELHHILGRVDSGTGLPNYHQFVDDLADLARDRPGDRLFLLSTELIDSTRVSAVQRIMGPSYLTRLSRAAGEQLVKSLGPNHKLYHVGPCQFAHLLKGNDAEVLERAEQLRADLGQMTLEGTAAYMLRPVTGFAEFELGATTASDILRFAHSASLDARQRDRSAGRYSSRSDRDHQRRFELLLAFQGALNSEDQLGLVYQPRIAMDSDRCVAVEALLRWSHPSLGQVSPAEFIPLVENTSMSKALTDWVMRRALQQAAIWHRQGLTLRVSVNIAASNLEERDFTQRLLHYLDEQQLPVGAIELELTESGLIGNVSRATQQLSDLIEAGLTVAIDDFGTGYSSLAYLQTLPAQVVKIDRAFINRVEQEGRGQTLVKSMIAMAHALGYRVVAEGVETRAGYEFLHRLGCDEAQGYWMSKPLKADALQTWLSQGSTTPA